MRAIFAVLTVFMAVASAAQTAPDGAAIEELQTGKSFIKTPVFTAEEDQKLLTLFDGLRVADVSDGMDAAVGLPNTGLMDPAIHPLWKDSETYRHRFIGIAVTARYVPTNRPSPGKMSIGDFDEWVGEWYSKISPEPLTPCFVRARRWSSTTRTPSTWARSGRTTSWPGRSVGWSGW